MRAIVAKKRSVVVDGRRTSISLEDEFWVALNMAAIAHRTSISRFVTDVMKGRPSTNLSSSVRIALLAHYQAMLAGSSVHTVGPRESARIIPFAREGRAHAKGLEAVVASEAESG